MKYEKQSLRTLGNHDAVRERLMADDQLVSSAGIALATSAGLGQVLDEIKKVIFYGKSHSFADRRIDSIDIESFKGKLPWDETIDLLHAAVGKLTEASEFADSVMGHLFEGKPLDKTNLIEEIGDGFWYDAIAANALGVSFEEIQQINLAKLKKRYPEKFTEECANVRDLDAERQVLEGGE